MEERRSSTGARGGVAGGYVRTGDVDGGGGQGAAAYLEETARGQSGARGNGRGAGGTTILGDAGATTGGGGRNGRRCACSGRPICLRAHGSVSPSALKPASIRVHAWALVLRCTQRRQVRVCRYRRRLFCRGCPTPTCCRVRVLLLHGFETRTFDHVVPRRDKAETGVTRAQRYHAPQARPPQGTQDRNTKTRETLFNPQQRKIV